MQLISGYSDPIQVSGTRGMRHLQMSKQLKINIPERETKFWLKSLSMKSDRKNHLTFVEGEGDLN